MTFSRLILAIFVILIIILASLLLKLGKTDLGDLIVGNADINHLDCIPTFADGGGPYYKTNSPFRYKIVPDQNYGEKLTVWGKVIESDCKTVVSNAVIDIWQANESGSYQDEWYRGRVRSNGNGDYSFETVIPKGYGEGTGYRPPHIHFKVFIDNKEVITSQMFFPEVSGKPGFDEAYIMKLTSQLLNGEREHIGNHNIIVP